MYIHVHVSTLYVCVDHAYVAQYADSADSAVGIGEGGREPPTCMHVHLVGARHDALYAYS